MARVIKFRFWKVGEKVMERTEHFAVFYLDRSDKNTIPLQFTGLLDTLGKEIYEDDIVTWTCGNEDCTYVHKGIIRWIEDLASWGMEEGEGIFPLQTPFNPEDIGEGIGLLDIRKVIGNVYENSNLLK